MAGSSIDGMLIWLCDPDEGMKRLFMVQGYTQRKSTDRDLGPSKAWGLQLL